MKVIEKYYKNSNTGELVIRKSITDSKIKHPDYFYNKKRQSIEDGKDLTGFVEIKQKTFNRECKRKKI